MGEKFSEIRPKLVSHESSLCVEPNFSIDEIRPKLVSHVSGLCVEPSPGPDRFTALRHSPGPDRFTALNAVERIQNQPFQNPKHPFQYKHLL